MGTLIPIASLHPFEALQSDAEIKAEISLLWPYSSSHASCALLLVDPDFRQRHARGEIRVRFEGPVAKVLARTKIGIGDQIRLRLDGAKWRDMDSKARSLTPGKPVEAELLFENHLHLTIIEDSFGGLDGRVVEFTAPPPSTSVQPQDPMSTPARSRASTGSVGLGTPVRMMHSSPAFMKRIRLSQELFLNSPGLHLDDSEFDSIHKRRKVSGSNGTKWTLLKEQPTIPELAQDEDLVDEEPPRSPPKSPHRKAQMPETDGTSTPVRDASMPPPTFPVLPMPDSLTMAEVVIDSTGPLKPKLVPVSPRSLPIPSPFPRTPLSSSALVSRNDTPSAAGQPTVSENASTSSIPGYFDLSKPNEVAFHAEDDASSSAHLPPVAVPLKQVVQGTEAALPIDESQHTPSSGSEADVSANEEFHKTTSWPVGHSVDTPEPNALASLRQSGDNTPMSSLPDISIAARVMGEFDDTGMSGMSTPSDDQTGDPESPLPNQRFLDSAVPSALPSSRGNSPVFLPPPNLLREQTSIVPSRLPNLNEHHPFGLDGAEQVVVTEAIESGAVVPSKERQAQASQDDEAAWEAMDEALHSLANNSRQMQQAPGPPLASILAPGPPGPDTMVPFTDNATQHQPAIGTQADPVVLITSHQDEHKRFQETPNRLDMTATNGNAIREPAQPVRTEPKADARHQTGEEISEVASISADRDVPAKTMDTIPGHVEGNIKSRKRPSSRLSLIPDSLNTWFETKHSDIPAEADRRRTIHTLGNAPNDTPANATLSVTRRNSLRKMTPSPPPLNRQQQSQGVMTDLTYLTPLTNLETYLNQTSEKVDVLAVVSNAASEPVRAKSGQRDSYTIMGVSSPALDELHSEKTPEVRVEVYRPWSPSLPSANKGDVILLRDFGVRSRGRKTYLLSGNESAWCAWKFGDNLEATEEVKGPPVEVGDAERGLVKELRVWWLERQARESKAKGKGKGRATL